MHPAQPTTTAPEIAPLTSRSSLCPVPRIPSEQLWEPPGATLMISSRYAAGGIAWYQHARVSTSDQDPSGQLEALRADAAARSWRPRPRRGAGPQELRLGLDSLLGSVRTIPPLQRLAATATIPCEFLEPGRRGVDDAKLPAPAPICRLPFGADPLPGDLAEARQCLSRTNT
jgi:hypothetical protein